uniref:Iron-sulfur cluster co-chaperone protein HscB, mitochondrial n=1 Tax=Cacopsylla melanoneura TaxID=428564 RepID=A0A8D8VN85_9HEMI
MFKSKVLFGNLLILCSCVLIVASFSQKSKPWLKRRRGRNTSSYILHPVSTTPVSTLIQIDQHLDPVNCWNCSTSVPPRKLFCPTCKTIQRPNLKQNYYDLLGLNQSFLIDTEEFGLGLKQLQRQLHPDKFTLKSKKERDISTAYSSFINKAYGTLEHPYERGVYLLSLHNITINDQTKTHPKFLMEMFDLNEQLDQAKTPEEMGKMLKPIREELHELYADTYISFEKNDLKKATDQVIRIKYLYNLEHKIDEKKYNLECELHGPVEEFDPDKEETEPPPPTTTTTSTTTERSKYRRKNNKKIPS